MAHQLYNASRTGLIASDVMGSARAQARRMMAGAAALRQANANLASARQSRAATLDRLAKAKAARAALRAAC